MRPTQTRDPIYASPIVWGLVVVATLLGSVFGGLGTGGGIFLGGVVGVLLTTVGLRLLDRFRSRGGGAYRADPWQD